MSALSIKQSINQPKMPELLITFYSSIRQYQSEYLITENIIAEANSDSSLFVYLMVFNATINNSSVISWRSALLVEETGGPRENQKSVASQ
jgi:hypothetical protein